MESHGGYYDIVLPLDAPTGLRMVTVTDSGDGLYQPAQASFPFTIVPRIGTVYECALQGNTQGRFTANVKIVGTVPTLGVAGGEVEIGRVEARLRIARTGTPPIGALTGLNVASATVELGIGGGGTVAVLSVFGFDVSGVRYTWFGASPLTVAMRRGVMVMSERSRSVLYRGLSDLIDDEEAVGEMLSSMPRDVDELATKDFVRAEIAQVRTELADVRTEIHQATNKIIMWNIGWTFTLAGLILAAVRLL